MNANELDELLVEIAKFIDSISNNLQAIRTIESTRTMLRQQQTEIDFLKTEILAKHEDWKHEGQQAANARAEIEALNELNTMLKDAIEKRIGLDAERYKWLRAEFAAGRETYLAEGIPSGESLDKYIDGKLK